MFSTGVSPFQAVYGLPSHIFHVSQLKKVIGQHQVVQTTTPNLSKMFEWVTLPEVYGYRKNPFLKRIAIAYT